MTAKQYIYRMLDTRPVEGSSFRMVQASDVQVEMCMIAFAREKVKEALEEASKKARPMGHEGDHEGWCPIDEKTITNAYPSKNIK